MAALLLPLVINLLSLLLGYDDAELLFVGDAMQHQAQIDDARRGGGQWDYSGCFADLQTLVEGADYGPTRSPTRVSTCSLQPTTTRSTGATAD